MTRSSDPERPTVQVESTEVAFEMVSGDTFPLPPGYGTFHDPSGKVIPECEVYFGPWKRTGRKVEPTRAARRYFGTDHKFTLAILPDIPREGWTIIGKVKQIFYVRRGKYRGGFYHPFVSKNPTLSKNGKLYKLSMGNGCLIDARGYVFPALPFLLMFASALDRFL